jgi:hypothetical protein
MQSSFVTKLYLLYIPYYTFLKPYDLQLTPYSSNLLSSVLPVNIDAIFLEE